jgi:hypothetical protein
MSDIKTQLEADVKFVAEELENVGIVPTYTCDDCENCVACSTYGGDIPPTKSNWYGRTAYRSEHR